MYGRIIQISDQSITIKNLSGVHEVNVDHHFINEKKWSVGDLVQVKNSIVTCLTSNRTQQKKMHWMEETLHPRRLHAAKIRSQIENKIKIFFSDQNFIETRTPLLVPCPGMETHIRPFQVKHFSEENPEFLAKIPFSFLPTSPEFAMKKLLVGGLEKIFQISPVFRDEPYSTTHRPEFTMLEWYRALATEEDMMKDTETLLESLAIHFFNKPSLIFQGQEISVKAPWPRLKVRDLFIQYTGIDLALCQDTKSLYNECVRLGLIFSSEKIQKSDLPIENWDDLYFKIWLNCIEPNLPAQQAVFVTRYPASQAALSVIDSDPDGSLWAKRFEAYAGGIELGNAFEELTNPLEQQKRFIGDMDLREKTYGKTFPKTPLDEEFLEALREGMPPSSGIAMGLDRIVMLLADEPNINYTFWI